MKLSFVIPAYNEEKRLPVCLESVFKEIEQNKSVLCEVLVVNNASTDRTKEAAKKYAWVIVVDEPKKGLTRARQAGFLKFTGGLISKIESDTILPQGSIGSA